MDEKNTTFAIDGITYDCKLTFDTMKKLEKAGLTVGEIEQHLQTLVMGSAQVIDWLLVLLNEPVDFGEKLFENIGEATQAFINAIENFFRKLNPARADVFAAAITEVNQQMEQVASGLATGENSATN